MASRIRSLGSRFVKYWIRMADDYRTVIREAAVDSVQHKCRSVLAFGTLGGLLYMINTNPSRDNYQDYMREIRQEQLQISDAIRNPQSADFLLNATSLDNQKRLKYVDFVLFSLILREEYSSDCKLYASQCKPVRSKLSEFPDRIVDVGLCGKWWMAKKSMDGFDINETEFASS